MVVWQRHLQSLLRQVGKRVEHNYNALANFSSSSSRAESSFLTGELPYFQRLWKSPSANVLRPFYQYVQQSGISSSRKLLADSFEETPIRSPLTPALTPLSGGTTKEQKAVSKTSKVQAVLKGIKQVIHSARANATHNHGLDADRLLVAEAFVGKGFFKKRIACHAKGRHGIKVRPECRLTVVVRETTPEEEAKIARLRVHNFRKLSKRERRLVPHKLIETTPIWNRKGKAADREPIGVAS
ncbi:hypothetical protein MANES_08G035900v8 [Manihot esculenta]|uniref:Uncharacterized protein n=1 Tax=Manihot esculenta TaxID=3983 RepID=A0ACB7H8C5_MANES|nr:hypothetical protein MANES_08G035900v8 [Manihot esculenta]